MDCKSHLEVILSDASVSATEQVLWAMIGWFCKRAMLVSDLVKVRQLGSSETALLQLVSITSYDLI